jgi:hypothetical protein
MPAYSTNSALPVEQLALAVVEGEGNVAELIGEKLLGPLPINWRNAALVKATLADSLGLRQISADKYLHAPGAVFSRLTATLGSTTLTITPRGVELQVPNEMTLDYRTRFDVLAFFCSRFGKEISGLTKEVLIAAQVFSTGNFGSATNSTVAYTAANLSTISFIADMIASTRRLKAKGEAPPYTAAMSGPVYERVRQAATVQAYTVGTLNPGQQADKAMILASLKEYGITELLVGDAYYNGTADQASLASTALTQVWSNTYIFVGKPGMTQGGQSADGVSVPLLSGIGANVYWEGYMPGGVPSADKDALNFAGGNYIEVYPDLPTDSEIIRIKMSQKPTVTNARAGDLIATQYS